jgi:Fur family transcriptional regulator, stress-responsive regulator
MSASGSPTTADELRGAGLRVTAARVALLETVRGGDHLDVEALATGVRDRVGHISLQAVYEALHALTAAGLIRRIEPAASPARFEGRTGRAAPSLTSTAPSARHPA